MAKLYFANLTKQHHVFLFQVPESDKQGHQTIRAGECDLIGGRDDFSLEQIEAIVKQHRAYGLLNVTEIKNVRTFVGHCYSVDRPVSLDKIVETMERNDEALIEHGRERRETLAAAAAERQQDILRDAGVKMSRSELSFVEETKDGSEPDIAEGYEVPAPGVAPKNPGKRRTSK